jgi:hypothetical protein
MRTRLALACLLALGATACSGALDAVAPRYFYGNLVRVDDEEICLSDPRDDEPDRQRCFGRGEVTIPDDVREGDVVSLRYELGEGGEEETAVDLRLVDTR